VATSPLNSIPVTTDFAIPKPAAQAVRADRPPGLRKIMPDQTVKLTYECVEQLHTWVRANCPCAMENDEFIPGLICIVEMEVETALNRQQTELFQILQTPSMQ
jgi:hypothetical protein